MVVKTIIEIIINTTVEEKAPLNQTSRQHSEADGGIDRQGKIRDEDSYANCYEINNNFGESQD